MTGTPRETRLRRTASAKSSGTRSTLLPIIRLLGPVMQLSVEVGRRASAPPLNTVLDATTLLKSYQESHMRNLIVLAFITLDGVMQASGG